MSFKLYDEDAILVEQLADTSSFTNLCTNVFRSHYKSQEDFRRNQISKLSGEAFPKPATELALIPMPVALWDAYMAKAQALTEETGVDVGCEELMLRVLNGALASLIERPLEVPQVQHGQLPPDSHSGGATPRTAPKRTGKSPGAISARGKKRVRLT